MKRFIIIISAVFTVLLLLGCPAGGLPTYHTVTYDGNSNDSGVVPAGRTCTEYISFTVAENSGSLEKASDGIDLTFYWNTEADGSGTDYAPGVGVFKMGESDVILYANWTALRGTGPAGGLIFYDDEADGVDDISGVRYLEAAPSDQNAGSPVAWSNITGYSVGITYTTIGSGHANTTLIINQTHQETTGGTTYCTSGAGFLCNELSITNDSVVYNDWFLPSRDELNEISKVLYQAGISGFSDTYWNSSEGYDPSTAGYQLFLDTYAPSVTGKSGSAYVRAVRAF